MKDWEENRIRSRRAPATQSTNPYPKLMACYSKIHRRSQVLSPRHIVNSSSKSAFPQLTSSLITNANCNTTLEPVLRLNTDSTRANDFGARPGPGQYQCRCLCLLRKINKKEIVNSITELILQCEKEKVFPLNFSNFTNKWRRK